MSHGIWVLLGSPKSITMIFWNHSFLLGKRHHGARPLGGKALVNEHLTRLGMRHSMARSLALGTLDGILFLFSGSGVLIYSCDVRQG